MKAYLTQKVIEVFGKEYELTSMERILGGAQKYIYLAKCTNDFEFVIYQWDKEPNRLQKVLESLGNNIDRLHSIKSEAAGQVGRMQNPDFDIISLELEDIRQNSSYLQEYDKEYADLYIQVEENIYTDISIQPAANIKKLLGEIGGERILFGTDYPFVTQAFSILSVLRVTVDG